MEEGLHKELEEAQDSLRSAVSLGEVDLHSPSLAEDLEVAVSAASGAAEVDSTHPIPTRYSSEL